MDSTNQSIVESLNFDDYTLREFKKIKNMSEEEYVSNYLNHPGYAEKINIEEIILETFSLSKKKREDKDG